MQRIVVHAAPQLDIPPWLPCICLDCYRTYLWRPEPCGLVVEAPVVLRLRCQDCNLKIPVDAAVGPFLVAVEWQTESGYTTCLSELCYVRRSDRVLWTS